MDKKDTVIEFLMEKITELKERIEKLDKHTDDQNNLITRLVELHHSKKKMSNEEFDEWMKSWGDIYFPF